MSFVIFAKVATLDSTLFYLGTIELTAPNQKAEEWPELPLINLELRAPGMSHFMQVGHMPEACFVHWNPKGFWVGNDTYLILGGDIGNV